MFIRWEDFVTYITLLIAFFGWLLFFINRNSTDVNAKLFGIFIMGYGLGALMATPSYPKPPVVQEVIKKQEGEIVTIEVYKRIVYGDKSGKEKLPE